MKTSEILRNAAKLVEKNEYLYGCDAISDAHYNLSGLYVIAIHSPAYKYFKFFSPKKIIRHFEFWFPYGKDGANQRIIALCMAAAIAESEGN